MCLFNFSFIFLKYWGGWVRIRIIFNMISCETSLWTTFTFQEKMSILSTVNVVLIWSVVNYTLASTASEHLTECCFSLCRHHGADRLSVGSGSWISGQCFCHLSHQELEVPADPAHAAYGSTRRHLEAAGICSLRPQQGDPHMTNYKYLCILKQRVWVWSDN